MKVIGRALLSFLMILPTVRAVGEPVQKFTLGTYEIETTAASMQVWGHGLAGLPQPLVDNNLSILIGIDAKQCPGAALLLQWLLQYRAMLTNPETKAADVDRVGKYIEDTVRLAMEEGGACRDLAMGAYTIGSVYLLSKAWKPATTPGGVAQIPATAGWTYLAIAAARNGLFTFTQERKAHSAAGSDARILGSYDCGDMKIAIDPAQRPLNLAATVIHELSHFYFDKFSDFNRLKGYQSRSFRYLLLLEEAIAAVHAGYLQRDFAKTVLAPQLQPDAMGDLTHYSPDGPLSKIVDQVLLSKSRGGYPYEDVARAMFFTRNNIINGETELIRGGRAAIDPYKRELFNKIAKSYFGRALTEQEQNLLAPANLDALFTEMPMGGGWSFEISIDMFFTPFTKAMWADRWSIQPIAPPKDDELGFFKITNTKGTYYADLRSAVELVGSLTEQKNLRFKSLLCRDFEEHVHSGVLKDYIGAKAPSDEDAKQNGVEGTRPGVDGARPGVDGVRPGVDGTRPGVDGTRPGVDGTRPGVDGVRPGVDGARPDASVRPCLQIGDRI